MRRGLVAIGGSCGEDAGFGMIAGTILVFGTCGGPVGAEMRRGHDRTVRPGTAPIAADLPAGRPVPSPLPPTDRAASSQRLGFPVARGLSDGELTLYHGDLLSLGKGEVWIRDDGATR